MASSLSEQVQDALSEPVDALGSFAAERRGRALMAESERLRIASLRYLAG